tara:strand:+ start:1526 stop:1882 length:357 start_codon:yes stop_codon:yes gene_type:complete
MELSSPRFKALAVSAGITFWFLIISFTLNFFTLEYFVIFTVSVFAVMQILSIKVSKALDVFAIFNTKLFLGILFVFVISFYGIFFKILQIDLLRLKRQETTYWLDMEDSGMSRISRQY